VLDVTRKDARQHLDLGYGIHTCLGQWISRLEAEVALTTLYRRFPELTVAGPIEYRRNYAFHGVDSLLVDPRW
jgi:cytochrome P450